MVTGSYLDPQCSDEGNGWGLLILGEMMAVVTLERMLRQPHCETKEDRSQEVSQEAR